MEAWILHIEEKWFYKDDSLPFYSERDNNAYSAWATEKQACKAASEFLSQRRYSNIFKDRGSLLSAVSALSEHNRISEAMELVNTYTEATQKHSSGSGPCSCRIHIVKSTFSGSPFE